MNDRLDVLIPARAGSVGLPGKSLRLLGDRPLILHSIACAQRLDHVDRIFVSTDDPAIAGLAADAGAYVPELRPAELATGDVPMSDVVRYAVRILDRSWQTPGRILLLDPTSPLRRVEDVESAIELSVERADADGVVSVSRPAFNPLWVGVDMGPDAALGRHPYSAGTYARRQDVPEYLRINGSFYIWRKEFASRMTPFWLDEGLILGYQTRELLSHSIDDVDDFDLVQALVRSGVVSLEWMES